MLRKILLILTCVPLAASLACSTTETANTNANNVGAANRLDSTNLPPGLSTSPIPMSANSTPGIPDAANVNNIPTGDIPGIPDPNKKTPELCRYRRRFVRQ